MNWLAEARGWRLGVAAKLNLLAAGVLVLTACSIGVVVMHMQTRSTLAALERQGRDFATMLTHGAERALMRHDTDSLDARLATLSANPDVAFAAFHGAGGELLSGEASAGALALDDLDTQQGLAVLLDGAQGVLRVVAPIATSASAGDDPFTPGASSETLGYLQIGLSTDRARDEALRFMRQALQLGAGVGLLAILVTLLVTRRLLAPVRELLAAAREVAAGRLGLTIPVRSHDELADLARAFQTMVDSLAVSRARLLDQQGVLERRVEARTRELRVATAQALDLAQRDTLTGLANRAYFMERLAECCAEAKERKADLALLFIDLDKFKRVNDSLGHDAGDRLLRHMADLLRACVRGDDLVARLGGDEFVVLAHVPGGVSQVEQLAERLLAAVRRPIDLDGVVLRSGFSIGIALLPAHADDAQELLRLADLAMYAAKQSGSGYQFFTEELNARATERVLIESGLRRALDRPGELRLVFQPQVDVNDGRLVGCEALLRWRQPDGSEINPADFIPVAEETGLIVALGDWVLNEACAALARWRAAGLALPRVAVNIAAPQFEEPGFCSRLERVIENHGLPASLIELELTERLLVGDSEHGLESMHRLKRLGVSLSVDDFGTGYSSLAYLSRLPLDVIKIDRSFVLASTTDAGAHSIVRTVIALAHTLGHRVVAEGVETGAQWQLLRRAGCDYVQGFFFSRPLEDADFRHWLADQRLLPRGAVPGTAHAPALARRQAA